MSAGLIKHLKTTAEKDDNVSILLAQWEFDQKLVGKALENVGSYYPHFSNHNVSHSQQILVNIERLLGDNLAHLSATDTWLLLESAYWHDIGMLFNSQEVIDVVDNRDFKEYVEGIANDNSQDLNEFAKLWHEDGWQSALVHYGHPHEGVEKYRQLVAEWYRRLHPENSQKVVEDPFKRLGINSPRTELLPKRIYRYLGQICLAHGADFNNAMKNLPYRQTGMGTENCHPRFVACLLRLGDLFDIDDNRFCPVMAKQVAQVPKLSKAHEKKHKAIREFQLDTKIISVTAECDDEQAYVQTQNWFGWIREEVQNQMSQWKNIVPSRRFGLLPTIDKLSVEMTSPKILLNDKPMQFSIDAKNAIDILQGANLYEDNSNIYREIIQNAIDATYMRMWLEHGIKKGNNYEISQRSHLYDESFLELLKDYPISIQLKKINDEQEGEYAIWDLIIQDKGVGISLNDLKHMQKIAGSNRNIERRRIISDMPDWMKPSGSFGVGLHSAFVLEYFDKINNIITFKTKSYIDNQSYKIEMHSPLDSGSGYCYIENLTNTLEMDYGTELSIRLRIPRRGRYPYEPFHEFEKLAVQFQQNYDETVCPVFDYTYNIYQVARVKEHVAKHLPFQFNLAVELPNQKNFIIPHNPQTNHLLWDEKYSIYFSLDSYKQVLNLEDIHCAYHSNIRAKFKGQSVLDSLHLWYFEPIIYLDFHGFDAQECLQVNRNKWKKDFFRDNKNLSNFFIHIFVERYSEIREYFASKEILNAVLFGLEIQHDDYSDNWKSLNLFSNSAKFNNITKKSYQDLLKLNNFSVFYNQTPFVFESEMKNESIFVSIDPNKIFFFKQFIKDWCRNGGLIEITDSSSEIIYKFSKDENKVNHLSTYHLHSFLHYFGVRAWLNKKDLNKMELSKFEKLACISQAHKNLHGYNSKQPYILLPYAKHIDQKNKEKTISISTKHIDDIIRMVFEELKKSDYELKIEKVDELYKELVGILDKKMEAFPELREARERGKELDRSID